MMMIMTRTVRKKSRRRRRSRIRRMIVIEIYHSHKMFSVTEYATRLYVTTNAFILTLLVTHTFRGLISVHVFICYAMHVNVHIIFRSHPYSKTKKTMVH